MQIYFSNLEKNTKCRESRISRQIESKGGEEGTNTKQNQDVSLKRGTFYHIVALDHFTRCNEKEKTLNPLAEVRLDFIARFLDASVHYYVFSQEDTIISDYPHGTESNTIYVLKSTVETLTEVEIKINRGEK